MNSASWQSLPLIERRHYLQQARSKPIAHSLIQLVRAPVGWGVYASMGPNYQFAVFGRDSIEYAEDVMEYFPELTREIIGVMARLQGHETNAVTEEEPGKIHHEYRKLQFNGKRASAGSAKLLEYLLSLWGVAGATELRYYGSIDATPLFVRLVGAFVSRYGNDILSDTVTHYSGKKVTINEALASAVNWIASKIEASEWGLLEFKRLNPRGLPYQAWKDSETAFLHTDGSRANADSGIASVEVQGFAFDALQVAAWLLDISGERRRRLLQLAQRLAHATIDHMWLPHEQFFAMGVDRDEAGQPRKIATLTSNAGLLLQTGLLSAVDHDGALAYVSPVVERLMSNVDFFTPAGIRCRSLRHAQLLQVADYHGSFVTWPKDTSNIAEGFRAWGFETEASVLEKHLIESIIAAGEAYEFFFVDRENHAKLHYRIEQQDEPKLHDLGAANTPEPMQAWTLACFLKLMLR
ncbi:MAG TPA: hypothetical protein VFZ58_02895 [Candidatus Saccharimonadales bacterium]